MTYEKELKKFEVTFTEVVTYITTRNLLAENENDAMEAAKKDQRYMYDNGRCADNIKEKIEVKEI